MWDAPVPQCFRSTLLRCSLLAFPVACDENGSKIWKCDRSVFKKCVTFHLWQSFVMLKTHRTCVCGFRKYYWGVEQNPKLKAFPHYAFTKWCVTSVYYWCAMTFPCFHALSRKVHDWETHTNCNVGFITVHTVDHHRECYGGGEGGEETDSFRWWLSPWMSISMELKHTHTPWHTCSDCSGRTTEG